MSSEIIIKISIPAAPGEKPGLSIEEGDCSDSRDLPVPSDDVICEEEESYPVPSDLEIEDFDEEESPEAEEPWKAPEPLEDLEDEGRPFRRRW